MTAYTLREKLEAGTLYLLARPFLPVINWMERATTPDAKSVPTPQEFYKDIKDNLLAQARTRTITRQQARRKADLPIDYY